MKTKSKQKAKDVLDQDKLIIGKRIDINWIKYKITKRTRYLEKLNDCINKLVKIDTKLEKFKAKIKK